MRKQRHPLLVRAVSALLAALAAGYLWAVVFGDAVSGLKNGHYLTYHGRTLPDANIAFAAALVSYAFGTLIAARAGSWQRPPSSGGAVLAWFLVTALAGAALFAASRAFA